MPSSDRYLQTSIETLENLVLMSAAGIDADLDLTELTDAEDSVKLGDEAVLLESEPFLEFTALPEFLQLAASSNNANLNAAANSAIAYDTGDSEGATSAAPYSQYIALNGQNNEAVLEDNGNLADNLVQLRSTNGTFETIVFELPTDVLVIDLGDGNDSLVVDGLELGTLSANVSIYGQGGDDSVELNSLQTVNDVFVYDMEGDNSLESRRLNIGGNLSIGDGDGDQNAFIRGTVNGDVIISSTSGDSDIRLGIQGIESTRVRGSVTIDNMGVGSDNIQLSGQVDGNFYIDAGDGDFELRSLFSSVRGSLFTNVDRGDATIFLGDFDVSEASYFNSVEGDTDTWLTAAFFNNGLTIQNGLGFDELRLDGTKISTGGTEPGLLTVNNRDGGSSTVLNGSERLFSLWIGEFQLNNGLGTDTFDFNLRQGDRFGTFYANNGDGDTTVEITGTGTIEAVTAFSGAGTDTFLIDGVDIENDLIINSGSGDRTVNIQNSVIGNTDINGYPEIETMHGDGDDEIFAPLGNNVIDGGAGDDVLVVYEGVRADYVIRYEDDGRVIVEGPGLNGSTVRNELTNVERILFNDGVVYLDGQNNGGGGGDQDPPTILGTDADDWIAVSDRGGNVEAGAGDDSIYAPFSAAFNQIDGGAGIDTLIIYEGALADFTVRRPSASSFVELEGPGLNGSTVINRLTDVEYVQFTDRRVRVADLEITQGIL